MQNKIQVILVDDCQSVSDALQFLFEMTTHVEFIVYNSGIEFLNNLKKYSKGVLLIDLLMPGMNGLALLEELQKRNHQLYTIVISAHADSITAQKVKEKGANEFLSKPFNLEYLLNKIKSLTESY